MLDLLNPFLIQFTENFGIRWYGLAYLIGFFATYKLAAYLNNSGTTSPLTKTQISDFIFAAALGTIIGGRLGYCLFYQPSLFLDFYSSPPFWGVLALQEGGMASHGGMIGVVVACFYYGWKNKIDALRLMDLSALGGCIGVFFGRIANFINGELYGRITSVPWGVRFPREILHWPEYQYGELKKLFSLVPQAGGSVNNLVEKSIELARNGNEAVRAALIEILPTRHPSQLYEALLEGLVVGVLLVFIYKIYKGRPGEVTKYFFIFYGIVRITGEQFRMPDPQIGFQIFDLTRGQILSVGLILLGVLWKVFTRPAKAHLEE